MSRYPPVMKHPPEAIEPESAEVPAARLRFSRREIIVGIISVAITLIGCFAAIYYWPYLIGIGNYGYIGVFVISIFAGGTIFVPVPGLLVVFTMGSFLEPALVAALAGLGEAIGGITIYLTGYGGRIMFRNRDSGLYSRLSRWLRSHGSKAIFVNAAIFNPLFYPLTAIAGMLHFGLVKFFLLSWAGKTVKSLIVAYAGYLGLRSLLRLLGAPL